MAELPLPRGCRIISSPDENFADEITHRRMSVHSAREIIPPWKTVDTAWLKNLKSEEWQYRRAYARHAFSTIIDRALAGAIPTLEDVLKMTDKETAIEHRILLRQGKQNILQGALSLTTTAEVGLSSIDLEGKFALGGVIPFRFRRALPNGQFRAVEAETLGVLLNAHDKFVSPPNVLERAVNLKRVAYPDAFCRGDYHRSCQRPEKLHDLRL